LTAKEEIRDSTREIINKWVAVGKDLQPVAVQSGIYAALMEIAAQLAELNEGLRKGECAIETRVVEP
jgi:tryptophanyl-tRNA synthetase